MLKRKIKGARAVGGTNKTVYVTDLSIRQKEETLSPIFLVYPLSSHLH